MSFLNFPGGQFGIYPKLWELPKPLNANMILNQNCPVNKMTLLEVSERVHDDPFAPMDYPLQFFAVYSPITSKNKINLYHSLGDKQLTFFLICFQVIGFDISSKSASPN